MKTVATTAIIFALISIAFGFESRIVGGSTARNGKYPYQVSLRVYFEHFCGGSILNDRWILTSATCIIDKRADEISVIAGTNLLSEAGQMYQAILRIPHPDFDQKRSINDIGLILVSRKIVYTPKIQPITLPTYNFNATNYPAILTGWGLTAMEGEYAEHLQEINLMVISQQTCAARQNKITDTHICTFTVVGEGACWGDFGGPLVADDTQIGIASFATPCAQGDPDVYTRVWSFVDWIRTTIRDHTLAGRLAIN